MCNQKVEVRKANIEDIGTIKLIADKNREELGFITRGTLSQAVEMGQVMVVTVNGTVAGFQHYYHRKRDKQTTLYHKAVLEEYRGCGLGTQLVKAVEDEANLLGRTHLLLKCPINLVSNGFHQRYGFTLSGVEEGKKRKLNIWILTLTNEYKSGGNAK